MALEKFWKYAKSSLHELCVYLLMTATVLFICLQKISCMTDYSDSLEPLTDIIEFIIENAEHVFEVFSFSWLSA